MGDEQNVDLSPVQIELLQRFTRAPMAMEPRALEAMMSGIRSKQAGIFEDVFGAPKRDESPVPEGVGLVPIVGSLMHSSLGEAGGFFRRYFGGRLYSGIWNSIQEQLDDRSVERLVLAIDSPGGEVNGLFELVDAIYGARGQKPITAIIDENATSAAYAIASAADRIVVPRTGSAGSIGVVAVHDDWSAYLERVGIDVTYVTSGSKKADGNPDEPLSDSARKDLQAEVDRLAEIFFETVARNRGLDVAAIRKQQAGVFHGPAAVEQGLVDEVQSVKDALQAAAPSRRRRARAHSWKGLVASRRHKNNGTDSQSTTHSGSREREIQTMSKLAKALQDALAAKTSDDTPRKQLVEQLAASADIGLNTMEAVIAGEIGAPPGDVLEAWSKTLGVEAKDLKTAAEADGAGEDGGEEKEHEQPKSTEGAGRVIDFGAARARSQGLGYATEVTELCSIAGCPERAGEFLKAETPIAQVRDQLLAARASEGPGEISTQQAGGGPTGSASDLWRGTLGKLGLLRKEDGGRA